MVINWELMMNLYVVEMDDEPFSYHLSLDEADKYLNDLKKVYPSSEIHVIDHKLGRKAGHDVPVWGITGVIDWVNGEVVQVTRDWFWKSLITGVVESVPKGVFPGYTPIYAENMVDGEFVNKVKKTMGMYKVTKVEDGIQVTQV